MRQTERQKTTMESGREIKGVRESTKTPASEKGRERKREKYGDIQSRVVRI